MGRLLVVGALAGAVFLTIVPGVAVAAPQVASIQALPPQRVQVPSPGLPSSPAKPLTPRGMQAGDGNATPLDAATAEATPAPPPPPPDAAALDAAAVDAFLKAHAGHDPWLEHGRASPAADKVIAVLAAATDEGLSPADYAAARLAAQAPHPEADFSRLLTLSLLRYARDLSTGRIVPRAADPELVLDKPEVDRAHILKDVADAANPATALAALEPPSPQYAALKAALATLRARKAAGGWPTVPAGPPLKPGMRDARVAALRARLAATGELPATALHTPDPDLYDTAVEAAVRTFQRLHGQEPDGTVGPRTLLEMNIGVGQRITQVLVNMERWRWVRHPADQAYVSVNLADYRLSVMRGTQTLKSMRVVVGATDTRSPVFNGQMRYIELNPYWWVPPSIAKKDLLPKLRRNPGYLAKNHYVLLSDWTSNAVPVEPYSVDWSKVTPRTFHWRVRQDPGNDNSLGRIKFMFPNKFDVYLHDTPSKRLFDRALRTFSHGCIRVQDPVGLALTVLELTGTPGWPEDKLRAAIGGDDVTRHTIRLKTPLPVEITYITALVDPDGTLEFRTDVYGRDARVAAALAASHLRDGSIGGRTAEGMGTGGRH